ncbi:MAG: hypothetical protein FWB83_08745 [Treponema sp.]|nr:hypothetical protein [Treponema sp.]MCL2267519.1 hypothetical protein [Treponema sp.]
MKKVLEKGRKTLRRLFLILGAASVSLIFQACYGMPMDTYEYEDEGTTGEVSEEESPKTKSE